MFLKPTNNRTSEKSFNCRTVLRELHGSIKNLRTAKIEKKTLILLQHRLIQNCMFIFVTVKPKQTGIIRTESKTHLTP